MTRGERTCNLAAMENDTRADSVAQLKTLADKLAGRTSPAEHIAANVLRDLASQLLAEPGALPSAGKPATGPGTGFGPGGAMAGWDK
jgi:hypothetical protein